jgi:O-6-methylguanine DNA methyltransferase
VDAAFDDMHRRFPAADWVRDDETARDMAAKAFGEQRWPLPIVLIGSPFHIQVWKALLRIPAGATATYGDVARWAGKPKAYQATGAAIGANPVSLLIPCHRVIAKRRTAHRVSLGPGAQGGDAGHGGGGERSGEVGASTTRLMLIRPEGLDGMVCSGRGLGRLRARRCAAAKRSLSKVSPEQRLLIKTSGRSALRSSSPASAAGGGGARGISSSSKTILQPSGRRCQTRT